LLLTGNGIQIADTTFITANNSVLTFSTDDGGSFSLSGAGLLANTAYITGGVQSTSPTSGSFQVQGGVGVTGDLHIGGNLFVDQVSYTQQEIITNTEIVQGALIANSNVNATSTTTGALQVVGGAGITQDMYIGGVQNTYGNINAFDNVNVLGNTRIAGNLKVTNQVEGSLYFNTGTVFINGSPVATSAESGFNGGNVSFPTNFTGTTNSTSSSTGQVTIRGGLGVAGNINSAQTVTADHVVAGNLSVTQANIGSLTSPTLTVSGDLSVAGSIFQQNIPLVLNDISNYFDGNACVFPLLVDAVRINSIRDSKDVDVSVNGLRLAPYVSEIRFPWFTAYDSYKGFRISNGNVIIYSAPQVGEQAVLTVRSTSQTAQTRRYPFSASTIALGD
jgi:hypothetical protein